MFWRVLTGFIILHTFEAFVKCSDDFIVTNSSLTQKLEDEIREVMCHLLNCPKHQENSTNLCQPISACECDEDDIKLYETDIKRSRTIKTDNFVCYDGKNLNFSSSPSKTAKKSQENYFFIGSGTGYSEIKHCGNYSFTNLTNNKSYSFQVFEMNETNLFTSHPLHFKMPPENAYPSPVRSLRLKNLILRGKNEYDAVLEWNQTKDFSCFYELAFHPIKGVSLPKHYQISGPKETYNVTIPHLPFDTKFSAKIWAKRSRKSKESEPETIEFQTPSCIEALRSLDFCPPLTPENLTILETISSPEDAENNETLYNVKLSWLAPEYQPEYYLAEVLNFDENWEIVFPLQPFLNISGNSTEAVFENVSLDFQYTVNLTAYSLGGWSPSAVVYKFKTLHHTTQISPKPSTKGVLLLSSIGGSIVLFLVIGAVIYFYLQWKSRLKDERIRRDYFLELKEKTADVMMFERNEDIDDDWEIDEKKLLLQSVLGEGAFGVVRRALLETDNAEKTEVAIKMLKGPVAPDDLKQMYQEMDIMKSVGKHQHIVSLLGCVTRGRLNSPFLIVEYCSKGNLQDFLRASWTRIFTRSNKKLYTNTRTTRDTNTFSNKLYDMEGEMDDLFFELQPKDLISFGRQIVLGMEYLSHMKVIHRDLAARNILVCEDRSVKVADFGLSRDVYQDNVYCKTGAGRLPVKWMAPESLTHQRYTTQSDVWSFGILLWEIVTLGGNPYAGISTNDLPKMLQNGYRLEKPKNCSDGLYELMYICWNSTPHERPNFEELRMKIDYLLETMTDYLSLELSKSYMYENSIQSVPKNKIVEDTFPSGRYITPTVMKKVNK